GAGIVGAERIGAHSRYSVFWVLTIIAWALPCLFVAYPKSVWFTFGVADTWTGIEGWKILLSGRSGLLMLGAGGFTAFTLWRERVALAALGARRAVRFERIANHRPNPIRIYRVEDEPVRRVPAE